MYYYLFEINIILIIIYFHFPLLGLPGFPVFPFLPNLPYFFIDFTFLVILWNFFASSVCFCITNIYFFYCL